MQPSRRHFLLSTATAGTSLGLGEWAGLLPLSPARADDARVTTDLATQVRHTVDLKVKSYSWGLFLGLREATPTGPGPRR